MSGRLLQDNLFAVERSILTGVGIKELRGLYAMDAAIDGTFQTGYMFQLIKKQCLDKVTFLTNRLYTKYQYVMCQIDWIFSGNRHEHIRLELDLPDDYEIEYGDAIVWYQLFKSQYSPLIPEKYYRQNYLFGVFLQKWLDLHPEDELRRAQLETELILSDKAMEIVLGQSPKSAYEEMMDMMYETMVEMREDLVITEEDIQ